MDNYLKKKSQKSTSLNYLDQEVEFCLLELNLLETFKLKPKEIEELDMFTLHVWNNELHKRAVRQEQEQIFESMKNKQWQNR